MLSKHIDILALTETWLSASDTSADICPNGFCIYHHPRHSGRGGGVTFLVPETYKVEIIHTPQYKCFKLIFVLIKHSSMSANFIYICHPPASTNTFFYECPDFFETTLQFQEHLCMFGDFNIHLDLPSLNTRSWMSFKHIITSTRFFSYSCSLARLVLQNLLALTSRQYFQLMVYQITIVSLLICGYKLDQNFDKNDENISTNK